MTLLAVENLSVRAGTRTLVSDLSFRIEPGKRMGLIGESGSGKSLTAMAVTGLLPAGLSSQGLVNLDGVEVVGALERRLNQMRGNSVAVVFQEPLTALDPLMKMGWQVAIPLQRRLRREGRDTGGADLRRAVLDLLARVSLNQPERIANSYPFEVSGGQRQRVAIAMALACRPKLLIADEPTTALDVTTQAEILDLLFELVVDLGMALLFISHDLPVVARIAEHVAVLRNGALVEEGPVHQVLSAPRKDYTKTLVAAASAFDQALGGAR